MREIEVLREIQENSKKEIQIRDYEISKLQFEKQQIIQEKEFLKEQITSMNAKVRESMKFFENLAKVAS